MMPLDDKWFNITELASRWNKSESWIEKRLFENKLRPSIFLPPMQLKKCEYSADKNGPYIEEQVYEYLYGGLFYINGYSNIRWIFRTDIISSADLSKQNISVCINKGKELYEFVDCYNVQKNEIVFTLNEVKRFETKHCLVIINEPPLCQQEIIPNSTVMRPSFGTDKELCEQLKLSGLADKEIAQKLMQAFPDTPPSKIGRLLPANPGANITNDGHRKRGKRLLK